MKLNIAIVEDILSDSARLESFINSWFSEGKGKPELNHIYRYTSGEEMLKDFEPGAFHVVFMDIIMNKLNGIETARKIRDADVRVIIVFMTTSSEYIFEAFPVHAFDYILKPYNKNDVDRVMSDLVDVLSKEEPAVTIKIARNEYQIPVSKIISAVARDHHVEINLVSGETLLSNMKFRDIERILSEHEDFIFCNKGVIVNMSQISAQEDRVFIMKNGTYYPIRKAGKAEITEKFSHYLISKMRYDTFMRGGA